MTEEREQIDNNTIGRSFVIGNKLSQTSPWWNIFLKQRSMGVSAR